MDFEYQRPMIRESLKTALAVFHDCGVQYRIVGSILIVALTNKIFRKIGDVDLLFDKNHFDCVVEHLKKHGFTIIRKRLFIFPWIEAKKTGGLTLTFLLVGHFTPDGFIYRTGKWAEIRIKLEYITPTDYSFEGIKFIGLPISSIAAGIQQSFLNPKRQLDKNTIQPYLKTQTQPYGKIEILLFGIRIPYLYDTYSLLYNLIGGASVLFGKRYEAWE